MNKFGKIAVAILIVSIIVVIALLSASKPHVTSSNVITFDKNFALLINTTAIDSNPFLAPTQPAQASPALLLANMASNASEGAVYNALGPSGISSVIGNQQFASIWNSTTPSVRCITLATLLSLGVPGIANSTLSNYSSVASQALNPSECTATFSELNGDFNTPIIVPNSASFYELAYAKEELLLSAETLGQFFKYDLSSGNPNNTSYLLGAYFPVDAKGEIMNVYLTSTSNGTAKPYQLSLGSFSADWLLLSSEATSRSLGAILSGEDATYTVNSTTGTITPQQFFYALAFSQYAGDQMYNALHGYELPPGIAMAIYQGGHLLVDLENVNPLASNFTVIVDGKSMSYVRYYNFIIVNASLDVGNQSIEINEGTRSYNATLYVNPAISISSKSISTNGTLSLSVVNPVSAKINGININSFTLSNSTVVPSPVTMKNPNVQTTPKNGTLVPNTPFNFLVTGLSNCAPGASTEVNMTIYSNLGEGKYYLLGSCT